MQQLELSSTGSNVWVLLEQQEDTLDEAAVELLGLARSMASNLDEKVCVMVLGEHPERMVDTISKRGADLVAWFEGMTLDDCSPDQLSEAITAFMSTQSARMFISLASSFCNDLFSRIAVRLTTGLVKNCVGLELNEEKKLIQTKPMFGGKVYGTQLCPNSMPQMATIKPGKLGGDLVSPPKDTKTIQADPNFSSERRVIRQEIIKASPETMEIDEADIIVAGGGGVGSAENFAILEKLAECLGGTVAASLVPVDKGWVNKNKTVGQTGKTVSPKLYIACGISGEHHHVLGMKDSENIIAINTDTYAPIFKIADIGVAGDMLDILPVLIQKLHDFSQTKN